MIGYIVRRLLDLVFVLLGVSILVFLMVRFIPGDAVEIMLGANTDITPDRVAALRHSLGLDLPIHAQYWRWLTGVLHGDLGTSIWTGRPVSAEILARAPATFEITGLALVLALVLALPLGVLAAQARGSASDLVVRDVADRGPAGQPGAHGAAGGGRVVTDDRGADAHPALEPARGPEQRLRAHGALQRAGGAARALQACPA